MPEYLYLASLFIACAYFIVQQIYLFNKGKYYPFGIGERDIKQIISDVVWVIVINLILRHINNPLFVQLFLIGIFFAVSILNYLSYLKTKDYKIIYGTIIFDIFGIVLFLLFFMVPNKGLVFKKVTKHYFRNIVQGYMVTCLIV